MKTRLPFALFFFLFVAALAQHLDGSDSDPDPARWVNPFIGTKNGGHVFPGATLPWGAVKAGPDSRSGEDQAGYVSDGSPITGFSSGCVPHTTTAQAAVPPLATSPFSPSPARNAPEYNLTKCTTDRNARAIDHGEPSASPGYFRIPLNNGVLAETTVTEHTALYRFTYPADAEEMVLLLDATGDLEQRYRGGGRVSVASSASPSIKFNSTIPNPKTNAGPGTRITGTGTFIPSFGQGNYSVFYCLDVPLSFKQAVYYETTSGVREYAELNSSAALDSSAGVGTGGVNETGAEGGFEREIGHHGPAGVVLGFPTSPSPSPPPSSPSKRQSAVETHTDPDTNADSNDVRTLYVRMGISFTSSARACAYAEEEIPEISKVAFEDVRGAARAKWNSVLSTVKVDTTGVSPSTQELFWTSLYRAYIAPINLTGDNPRWESHEPYYDSFYCIWDTFRVIHPLYAITAPAVQAEVVRALIDIWRFAGWLPDCRMSTDKGFTQGGSNADSLLSDSFVKGIKAGIDWDAGFEAMVKDATVMGDFEVEGRGGINSRRELGYVPAWDTDHPPSPGANTRSASRLLEYAYNDFSIALVAQGLSRPANITQHYFNVSGDWANIWNPDATHAGFQGFIQPRNKDGSWFLSSYDQGGVFRPDHCSPVYGHNDCYGGFGGGEFYEASSWEYSFYVPHDMASLVHAMGGPETFSARLDKFFEAGFHDMGDEPGFLPTYLYNYVGQPTKTVDRVDASLAQYYSTEFDGLPGNDDSGSMGAYVVWTHFGFYPVAGQDTYLLNRPYFPKITLRNDATGALATIIAHNFSAENKYVQSATLNGETYTKNWISHKLFKEGGVLELVMGASNGSTWGTGAEDLPPSLSTGGFGCEGCGRPKGLRPPTPANVTAEAGPEPSSGSAEGEADPVADEGAGPEPSSSVEGEVDAMVDEGEDGMESTNSTGFFSYLIFLLLAD
ncbi:alpha-1,2-mannosidase, putative subfamily [Mycena galericulata]|nr:alpha-1,2-mannosidase, putative subfamily [Mycena galericulata]